MNKTGIEYLTHTWNPTKGCTKLSTGCENCWAKAMAQRLAGMGMEGYDPDEPFKVMMYADRLEQPSKSKKSKVIGVSFMGDILHKDVPDYFIMQVLEAVHDANWHEYVFLTKRPERLVELQPQILDTWPSYEFDHCRFGISIEDMKTGQARMDEFAKVLFLHKWISLEPMVGPVNIKQLNYMNEIGQITLGGESGHKARPMHPDWARQVRDDCADLGIPFWMKQMAKREPIPEDLQIKEWFNDKAA